MSEEYLFRSQVPICTTTRQGLCSAATAKTLFINCDPWLAKVLKNEPDASFEFDFFASAVWPNRPNSTFRLNLVNYQAIRHLSDEMDVRIIFHRDLPENMSEYFDNFTNVVIMQVRNEQAITAVKKILSALSERPTRARLIFGTELTWFAEMEKGNFTKDQLRKIYTEHTLLRHTAKTDVRAYADDEFENSIIQEFEIGIDTDVVKPQAPILERNRIIFVKAPEGRQTKNNEAVEQLMSAIGATPELAHLQPTTLQPPYSTTEYWDLLQESRYFVFTSMGETFSYVLNDARSIGTVSFFPTQMYENRSGSVVVDSYPDMAGRYTNETDLVEKLKYLEKNNERLLNQSRAARNHVLQNYSLPAVKNNWRSLLCDQPINNNSILFLDFSCRNYSMKDALELCKAYNCRYLLPYLNQGPSIRNEHGYSWYSEDYDVAVLRDFIYKFNDELKWTRSRDGRPAKGSTGKTVTKFPVREALRFWRVLTRVNKISEVITNVEATNDYMRTISTQLKVYGNSRQPFMPIAVKNLPG